LFCSGSKNKNFTASYFVDVGSGVYRYLHFLRAELGVPHSYGACSILSLLDSGEPNQSGSETLVCADILKCQRGSGTARDQKPNLSRLKPVNITVSLLMPMFLDLTSRRRSKKHTVTFSMLTPMFLDMTPRGRSKKHNFFYAHANVLDLTSWRRSN
jgi:hypothetical protein